MDKFERGKLVEKEKDLIKKIILSRINNDGKEDLYVEGLKQIIEQNNEAIMSFFDSDEGKKYIDVVLYQEDNIDNLEEPIEIEQPTDKYEGNSFYRLFCDYLTVADTVNGWNNDDEFVKYFDLDVELARKYKILEFTNNYLLGKRLKEVTDWFFNLFGDTEHEKEEFAKLCVFDAERAYALRNELTNNGLELTIDKADLEDESTRSFLLATIQMRLCHDFIIANLNLAESIDKSKGNTEPNPGALLFLLLNTTAFISLAKEYGFAPEQLDLNNLVDVTKRLTKFFPHMEDQINVIGEIDHLIENANNLADSYLMSLEY